ncbi:MAG: replicative DNA helicase [Verrucomicrobiota bacterium]|jgi:replicative DNA helicase|nr:replicative DNA helicase [Verrucomicrobiota bacterium]
MAGAGEKSPGAPVTPRLGDRIPPYSEDAERAVLGSILQDAERLLDLCGARQISTESFYVQSHRSIYETMLELSRARRPVDILTVSDRLREKSLLDGVGGEEELARLIDGTPTTAHAEYYIQRVYENHLLRRTIDTARIVTEECYKTDLEAETVLGRAEEAFFQLSERRVGQERPWADLVEAEMAEAETLIQQKKGLTGISTGFVDIDQILLGMQPGDLMILAARPSMGKTSLALNIAENVATGPRKQPPRPVAVFSLEMSAESLVRRMICCRAGVSSQRLSQGMVGNEEHGNLMGAADVLRKAPLYVDDSAGLEIEELRSRARRLKRKYDIQFMVVDYLQLLNCSARSRDGRQQETAAISQGLKAIAKELRIPVLVLSQFSRAPETRGGGSIPKLSDLRDSGAIEQDADIVFLLRRPCYYKEGPDSDDKTLAIVDIAKHRNGPTGEVRLNFFSDYTRFENRFEGVDHGDEE